MILLKIRVEWGTAYSFYKLSVTGFFYGASNIHFIKVGNGTTTWYSTSNFPVLENRIVVTTSNGIGHRKKIFVDMDVLVVCVFTYCMW
jgi:hypothetical protein